MTGTNSWQVDAATLLVGVVLRIIYGKMSINHKQKWTAKEEATLKAGIIKHGSGKWRTILTDPEFSSILVRGPITNQGWGIKAIVNMESKGSDKATTASYIEDIGE
ncbi:hypothetical protein P8452_52525 [Trifolium repens]|nr:hypothetical protein P8452_52525 [Trifolium repens]